MDKLHFIKKKDVCFVKDIVKKKKGQITDWKKYLQITYSTK